MSKPTTLSVDSTLSFEDAHAAWHENVEAQRTSPHGPLSVTALHWLTSEAQELPELPGLWSAAPDGTVTAWFVSADGVALDGAPALGTVTLGPFTGIDGVILEWGEKRIDVAARGGRIAVRPRDPASRDRAEYTGTGTFPADPAWIVTARYVADPRPGTVVDTAVPGSQQLYDSPGRAEFEVDGRAVSLTLFGAEGDRELRALFADATGEDLTFPHVRVAQAIRVDDGTVVIDFNRTVNPPYAYSDGATCPLPPAENRLPVRIEAGELRPGVRL